VGRGTVTTRSEKHQLSRRNAQLVGAAGVIAAAFLPVVLWHRAIAIVASDFRLELGYLVTGWAGYGLILLGVAFLIPVAASIGRGPESRLYVHARNAYLGWGLTLYLLGVLLAVQVASIARGPASL
jgi:hypothetical protein